jgi:hypothetical protein
MYNTRVASRYTQTSTPPIPQITEFKILVAKETPHRMLQERYTVTLPDGLHEYTEPITNPPYEGTIIDVETNHDHQPICFGSLHGNTLSILYITDNKPDTWHNHAQAINDTLEQLPRPYLAFRAEFDQEVVSNFLGRRIPFDGDLHVLPHSKDRAYRKLGGPPIPDPLRGKSSQVPHTWDKYLRTRQPAQLERITKHNRACLLKETYLSQQAGWTPLSDYAFSPQRTISLHPNNTTTQLLLQSLRDRKIIELTYINQKGDETQRQTAVLSLGHQYFTAYCYLRHEIRTFKTTRITHLKLTNTTVHPPDHLY